MFAPKNLSLPCKLLYEDKATNVEAFLSSHFIRDGRK